MGILSWISIRVSSETNFLSLLGTSTTMPVSRNVSIKQRTEDLLGKATPE